MYQVLGLVPDFQKYLTYRKSTFCQLWNCVDQKFNMAVLSYSIGPRPRSYLGWSLDIITVIIFAHKSVLNYAEYLFIGSGSNSNTEWSGLISSTVRVCYPLSDRKIKIVPLFGLNCQLSYLGTKSLVGHRTAWCCCEFEKTGRPFLQRGTRTDRVSSSCWCHCILCDLRSISSFYKQSENYRQYKLLWYYKCRAMWYAFTASNTAGIYLTNRQKNVWWRNVLR